MSSAAAIRWEDAFRSVIPQINADGLLVQKFDPALPVQVRFYSYDPSRDYRSCRHDYFELFYLSSGAANFRIGEQSFPVRGGDLIVINSTQFHNVVVPHTAGDEAVKGILLYFLPDMFRGPSSARDDIEYLGPFLNQDKSFPYLIPSETRVPAMVRECILAISAELPARSARARVAAKTHLRMILLHLLNHFSAFEGAAGTFELKHRSIQRLEPLFSFLDKHYAEPVSLEDAASIVGMSKSHFIHFMKQVTGLSFVSYLNQFRIAKAQQLIRTTGKSLAEISQEVGFCDQSYFGHVFRKLLRVTPRDYRIQLQMDRLSSSHQRNGGEAITSF